MMLINARGKIVRGESAIKRCLQRWNPLDPFMVIDPETKETFSALSVDQYATLIILGLRQRMKLIVLFEFVGTLVLAFLGLHDNNTRALNLSISLAIVLLFVALDIKLVLLNLEALRERSNFTFHLRKIFWWQMFPWLLFMLSCGAFQLYCQHVFGGFEPAMERMGIVYTSVLGGQWWRVLYGSFFHASLMHWLGNLAYLLAVAPIASFLSWRNAAVVFFIGVTSGACASVFFDGSSADSFVGVSGGIFALLGWCTGCALMKPGVLPKNFFLTCLTFTVMSIGVAHFTNVNVSSVAHIAGFFVGICYGVASVRSLKITSFVTPIGERATERFSRGVGNEI